MKTKILSLTKSVIVLIHAPLTYAWKILDMSLSWPDFWPIFRLAPVKIFGGIGGDSYTGWVYQQGFFAALLRSFSDNNSSSLTVLDFGCGLGKIVYPSSSLILPNGRYIGVDIIGDVVERASKLHRNNRQAAFYLSKDFNLRYNRNNISIKYGQDWPVKNCEVDILTALSVFTHLREVDTIGYLNKIYEILKPKGLAILTFHIIYETNEINTPKYKSKWMPFLNNLFKFEHNISEGWYCSDPDLPETAIGISEKKLNELLEKKFEIKRRFHGSTTGGNDLFPQDIIIIEKSNLEYYYFHL